MTDISVTDMQCAEFWLPVVDHVVKHSFEHDFVFFLITLFLGFLGGQLWTGRAFLIFCKPRLWLRSVLRSSSATDQGTKHD